MCGGERKTTHPTIKKNAGEIAYTGEYHRIEAARHMAEHG